MKVYSPPNGTPKASIVIPSHNEGGWLRRTVEAVQEATRYQSYEIVVVDDGSTDGSSDFLAAATRNSDQLQLIRGEGLGVAGARSLGAERAQGEVLVFIDAHVLPSPGWLECLLATLKNPGVGVAGLGVRALEDAAYLGHCYIPANANLNAAWSAYRGGRSQPTPAVIGCCFAVPRPIFEEIGGFDPGAVGWGVDDIEFGLRAWYMGYRCLVSAEGQVAHWFKTNEDRSYEVSWEDYDVNLLRAAFTYFDGPRLSAILINAAGRPSFAQSLARVQQDQAYWQRRRWLRERFKRDEGWFFSRFQQALAPLERELESVYWSQKGRPLMEIQRDVACPNCGAKNLGVQERCLLCQAELPTPAVARRAQAGAQQEPANPRCPHCAEALAPGVRFCTHCGRPVTG